MKKTLLISALLINACSIFAQSTLGLVAHWDMNGTVNDVSGNGNNGTPNNLMPAAGADGVMGTGYYFNGSNSYITVPYSTNLNLNKFSICAKVKVMGFYNGLCQGNVILSRGPSTEGTAGDYALAFDDNAYDNNDCYSFDSTKDVFYGIAGYQSPNSSTSRYYTPNIIENVWYCIVITFDDTVYKTYVNDSLMNIAPVPFPGAFGSSTDGISIGYDIIEAAQGYPYPFNGVIDDIALYNRVLDDSERINYCSGDSTILSKPATKVCYPNPVRNVLSIQDSQNDVLRIFDMMGREVYKTTITSNAQSLDVSNIATGMYLLQLTGPDGNKSFLHLQKE